MYCRKCGFKVEEDDSFCPKCGAALKRGEPEPPSHNRLEVDSRGASKVSEVQVTKQPKNEGLAALLAFLLALIGFLGMGHIYAGRVGRGLILFFVGILLEGAVIGLALYYVWDSGYDWSPWSGGYTYHSGEIGYAAGAGAAYLIWFILWIWQTFNARKVCRIYNQSLEARNQSKS